jgi:hypothetical protein
MNGRIDTYYIEYHKMMKEVFEFLMPKFHLDIHTYECLHEYTPNHDGHNAESIGIQLYSPNSDVGAPSYF